MYTGLAAQVYYGYASLAVVLLGLNLLWMVFVRLNGQLQELASRDALTRVLNRNGLDDALARHFAARDAAPVTLLELDVDHFKRINDEFGHATGDQVLSALADTLVKHVRGNDFVARMGGEEFLVGCVGGDRDVALGLGERLRAGVAAVQVPVRAGAAAVSCTVSIGVSRSFGSLAGREAAAREADEALYAAKAGGRNRVVVFEPVTA
jgi:diguanylate cyclase (GGDEF)-like protein